MARALPALLFVLASLLACGGGGSPAQPVGPGNTTLSADAQSDATLDEGGSLDAAAADATSPSDASVPDVSTRDVQGDP